MKEFLFADWPFYASGAAIGIVIVAFAAVTGRGLGVSRGLVNLCALGSKRRPFQDPEGRDSWRLPFLIGLPLGVFLVQWFLGDWRWRFDLGMPDGGNQAVNFTLLLLGGVGIGFGARKAGGCTSGHAITGMALRSPTSLLATLGFLTGAIGAAHLLSALPGTY